MTRHTFTRHDVSFTSGDAGCAAWLYLPDGLTEPFSRARLPRQLEAT